MLDEGGPALAAALEVLADPDSYPGGVPLRGRQGPHRGAGRRGAEPARRRRRATSPRTTGSAGRPWRPWSTWVRVNVPDALDTMTDQPPAFLAAPPQAMVELLAEVRATHGSMAGYVATIGVGDDVIAALHRNLLV